MFEPADAGSKVGPVGTVEGDDGERAGREFALQPQPVHRRALARQQIGDVGHTGIVADHQMRAGAGGKLAQEAHDEEPARFVERILLDGFERLGLRLRDDLARLAGACGAGIERAVGVETALGEEGPDLARVVTAASDGSGDPLFKSRS